MNDSRIMKKKGKEQGVASIEKPQVVNKLIYVEEYKYLSKKAS